ncbi:MAG TPA: CHAT domain-containing protein [Polyangium sp.]|nr:CHAT domain-containing protein [Polyangium sp.]
MLEIVIEVEGTKVKATAFGSRMERPAPQIIGDVTDIEVFGKKVGRSVKTGKLLETEVVEDARRLYEALFAGEIRDVLTRIRSESGDGHVLVRLLIRNRALQAIPWEALCQPGTSEGFLAAGTRLDVARGVSSSEPTQPHSISGAIRLLPIAPTGDAGLANLQVALGAATSKGKLTWLEPITGERASPRNLFQRLRSDEPAHIIHFLGHGGVDPDGNPALRLADDEYGDEVWLKAEALATELAAGFGKELRLVVLEACEGASLGLLGSAAEILARAGAQAVIAYLWPVRAEMSRTCSEEFYRALILSDRGRGDVARCLSAARRTMLLESASGFSPVLYLRGADPVLFDFGSTSVKPIPAAAVQPVEAARFFVPFKKNPHFVGRDSEAEKLHQLLQVDSTSGANMVALSGMGGIGKTLIAAEYAYRYREAYPDGVYWINAAQDWQVELGRLGKLAGCRPGDGPAEQEHLRLARAFADSLRTRSRSLLIFDNVENPLELQDASLELVPARLECKLVFTTRRRELPAAEVFVGVLSEEPALALLLAKSHRKEGFERLPVAEQMAARMICSILDGHPLAIALAGAYLEKNPRIAFSGYLEGLQTEGALAVMDATRIDARLLATQHEGNVAVTLNVQWKSIQGDGARLALQTAALLAESALIPRARLALLTGLSDQPHSWREAPLEEALRELASLSLLEEFGAQSIKLHRLVRELIHRQIPERKVFAAARSATLLEALWDVQKLQTEVARRGVLEVLGDLHIAQDFANDADAERLNMLIRPLDREMHHLLNWNEEGSPGFFLQQLHNQALELGLDVVAQRARAALDSAKVPWLGQCFPTHVESSLLVRTFDAHRGGGHGLAISADGRFLVSAGADNTVKFWDWHTGQLIRTFSGHLRAVNGVAMTPDGLRIISGSEDRTVRIWDVETGKVLHTCTGHTNSVFRVAVTPDGRLGLSASQDGTIRIWDLASGQTIHIVEKSATRASDAAYQIFAATAIIVTPDGKFAVSASQEGLILLWDVATWRLLRRLTGHTGPVWSVAVSRDARLVVSAGEDGLVKSWNTTTGACLHTFTGVGSNAASVALTNDERCVIAGFRNGLIQIWEVATGREVHSLRGHSACVFGIVTTSHFPHAISISRDNTIRVWDLTAPSVVRNDERHQAGVYDLTLLPGEKQFATVSLDTTIKLHDLTTGQVVRTLQGHEKSVMSIAVTSDGRRAVTGSDDKSIWIWDLESGQVIRKLEGHTDVVRGIILTADDRLIISASYDRTIRVWDFATGLVQSVFEGHALAVRDVALTPDGRYLVSASLDTTLRIWDMTLGIQLHVLEGHHDGVWSLAISPDGRYIVSGGKDCVLKIWEVATGQLVRTLVGHSSLVLGVAILADGKTVVSASGDMTVKAWDMSTGREIVTLKSPWPLACCVTSAVTDRLVIGTTLGAVLVVDLHANSFRSDKRTAGLLEHLLEEGDWVGRAALDVLMRVPRARWLIEEGGPEECAAGLLVAQALARSAPAIDLAAGYFATFSEASFVDYVDALGLEGMFGGPNLPDDEAYWTNERIEALRNVAFEVSWNSISDADTRRVLCTLALLGDVADASLATIAIFSGTIDATSEHPYARTDALLEELSRRGWLERILGDQGFFARPRGPQFVMSKTPDWSAFATESMSRYAEYVSDIENVEREVARRGVNAVAGDLRIGSVLRNFGTNIDQLLRRWRVFGRETYALTFWEPQAIPAFFMQQLRNRAFDMGEDGLRGECEAILERRKLLWFRDKIRLQRESISLMRRFSGHAAEVRAVVFRINGDVLQFVSGSDDRTVRVWDLTRGLLLHVFEGHSKAVIDVAITPDGRYVASASEDGTIRKWDLWTQLPVGIWTGHDCGVVRVAISPDGAFMVSAGKTGEIFVWNFESGEILIRMGGGESPINWIAYSMDSTRSVMAMPMGPIEVHRLEDSVWKNQYVLEGHPGGANDVVVMLDPRFAISAGNDGTIKYWDIENGHLIRTLEGHTGPVTRVIPSGDDRHAVSVSRDKTVRVWDLLEGKQLSLMRGHSDAICGVDAYWPAGMAVTASADSTICLWTQAFGAPDEPIVGHNEPVYAVAVTPDGRTAISSSTDLSLGIWDVATGQLRHKIENIASISLGLTVAPDGQTIVAGCDDGRIRRWDLNSGKLVAEFDLGGQRLSSVTITSDARVAIVPCHDKVVRVVDAMTGALIRALEGHLDRVRTVALTPDEKYVISGSFDNSLRVWDWQTGKTLRVLQGHTSALAQVVVTPDGRHAISCSFDRTWRVWELATGRLVRTVEGHLNWVLGVVVTPNGQRVISASQDATLAMWDLSSGKRIANLVASTAMHCVALTPDGKTVVSGDGFGAVRFVEIVEG